MRALLLACHPVPTCGVTALATGLAIAWGRSPAGVLLVMVTVLAGQLSIGWFDDATDVRKDAGRSDKPIVAGHVSLRAVRIASVVALAVSVVLSLMSGPIGLVHLLVVGSGWIYAWRLERTVWSWLPYVVAFGALPAFVHLGAIGPPPWWIVMAGSLLGLGAHFANVLPDIDRDLMAGVRGLPQRLGAGVTRWIAPVPPAIGTAVLVFGPPGPVPVPGWGALLLSLAAIALPRKGNFAFVAVLVVAAIDVILLAVN